ncbi:hypothetical protein IGK_01799 [Bacillus toyonensis]|nr:hypothetical protein IGK_01799 [Bacillus toyonensis]
MGYFKGKQFKKDIILVAVGYYCRFSLSYRDVYEILKKRDHQAAYMFMKRLIKAFGEPAVLTTDKAPALICAFKKLQKDIPNIAHSNISITSLNRIIDM